MKEKIVSIFISIIILFFSISFFIFKKIEFSYNENRYLQTFPKFNLNNLKTGKNLEEINNYVEDHFPFRTNFINLKTEVMLKLNFKEVNNVYITDKYLIEKYNKPVNTDKLINKLNNFNSIENVNMMLLLVPTSISIYSEYLPNYVNNEQTTVLDYIYAKTTLKPIKITENLLKNKEKYQLYYYLDHHWTTYGAYFAYQEYCKQNNIDYYEINDFTIEKVSSDFKGTIYSKILKDNGLNDDIYKFSIEGINHKVDYGNNNIKDTLYDIKYLSQKDKYSYYLSNNNPIIKIESNSSSNQELLIIKDSFANCFIPFLANHYKKITVIDPRYYKLSIKDYIINNNINNVLFLYNLNTIDSDTGIYTID